MKLAGGVLAATMAAVSAHPIQKVIDMMVDLKIKAKEEGENEQLAYQKFAHWCGNEKAKYTGKVAANKEKISTLESKIDGLKASTASLETQIQTLKDEIAKRESDQANANGIRDDEKGIYDSKKSDLESTIDAVKNAVSALNDSKSVLEVRSAIKRVAVAAATEMSTSQHQVLRSFLQEPQDGETVGDARRDRARKYDFKSNDVIELLEGLRDDFKQELLETVKAENNAINSHALAKKAQENAITAAQNSQSEKEKILSDEESALAQAEGDLSEERNDLDMNETTLKDTTQDCRSRANEFDERAKAREGEQDALATAVEILAKVADVRNPLTHKIAQKESSFLQMQNPREKAINLINRVAKQTKSGMLERLAAQIKVSKGPFKQIKNAIQKMMFRLNKEQTDEDNHKHWCDQELETTTLGRDTKQDQVDEMTNKIAGLTANIESLSEAISEAEGNIADTNKYMKDETELRQENHKQNQITIKDSKDAQQAVTQAIGVLTQYYKESGAMHKEEWEFLQKPALAYSGSFDTTDGSTAVMELLEEVLGNFSKMEAEATAADEQDEHAYGEDMKNMKVQLAKLRSEVKTKTARRSTLEEDKAGAQKQLKKADKQLGALQQYLKDLEPACVTGDGSSYDQRRADRDAEIGALKQALDLLANAFKPNSFLAVH